MNRSMVLVVLCAVALASTAVPAVQPCGSLASLSLANNTVITLATPVAADQFTPPDGTAVTVS